MITLVDFTFFKGGILFLRIVASGIAELEYY